MKYCFYLYQKLNKCLDVIRAIERSEDILYFFLGLVWQMQARALITGKYVMKYEFIEHFSQIFLQARFCSPWLYTRYEEIILFALPFPVSSVSCIHEVTYMKWCSKFVCQHVFSLYLKRIYCTKLQIQPLQIRVLSFIFYFMKES